MEAKLEEEMAEKGIAEEGMADEEEGTSGACSAESEAVVVVVVVMVMVVSGLPSKGLRYLRDT